MPIHTTLEELYDADTQDRVSFDSAEIDEATLKSRDAKRFQEVSSLLSKEEIDLSEIWNLHYLCVLHMHAPSTDPKIFEQAHEFAQQAVNMGSKVTRWLYAASLDRWLVSQGKLQKYGTQFDSQTGELLPTNASTSDEERASFGIPPLAKLIERT